MKENSIFQLPWKTRIFLAAFFVLTACIGADTFLRYGGILTIQIELMFYLLILSAPVLYVLLWKQYRKKMIKGLFKDVVTDEWNEQYFRLYYERTARKEKQERWIVYFDIDRFKMINLLYGTRRGNLILKTVCEVFHLTLPEDKIFHCGRDVFLAYLNGRSQEDIRRKLLHFQDEVKRRMEEGEIPQCSLSFGICAVSRGSNLEQICANAWFARQEAKEQIADKIRFYGESLQLQMEKESLEMRFPEALKQEEFLVWYQPKYDLRTGQICGAEALVRWKDQDGKVLSPARFIPVFESTGQIVELDVEALRMVCEDIRRARRYRIPIGNISVNLSKLHVIRTGITDKIREIAGEAGIGNKELSFEITESAAEGEGREELAELVRRLQNMGFMVYMDDYGTGSSTLRSLADTHFDVLKLDRSFVSLAGDPRINIILISTIHMAKCLGMDVVAEGVETKEQADFLLKNGCHLAQGYYFSRPLPRDEFFQRVREGGKEC